MDQTSPSRGRTSLARRIQRSAAFRSRRLAREVGQELFAAKLAVARRKRLTDHVSEGVTVVAVTWNSVDLLKTLLGAVELFSKRPVEIIIVDNGSTDGTEELLRSHPEVGAIHLRRNWGHGLALDLGVQAARTRYIITLDIDAFPVDDHWIDAVIDPLEEGSTLAGALSAGYIHPCYMALERQRFLADKHTFAPSYHRRLRVTRRRGHPKGWDVGKLITLRDTGRHTGIPPSSTRGPGPLGTVFGGVVYHHFYATRLASPVIDDVIRSGVTLEISRTAWQEAVGRYLSRPSDSLVEGPV